MLPHDPLRLITYLAPGLPPELFHCLAAYLGRRLGRRITLKFEESTSGPVKGGGDPLSADEADVSWMCSPSFLWMRETAAPVELVPAGFVFRDVRARGLPVYFSEVIVRRESTFRSFSELRGARWAYNDPCSLSGYHSLLRKLADMGEDTGFFSELTRSGGHQNSLASVGRGEADAAAIDSNVLALARRTFPELLDRLRVLESWGPYAIQPCVARRNLPQPLKRELALALQEARDDPAARAAFGRFGLEGFAPVAESDYAAEWRLLGTAFEVRDAARNR